MRKLAALAVLFAFSSCTCVRPPTSEDEPDGSISTLCVTDSDCALGEMCQQGRCGPPELLEDGGLPSCDKDSDCPQGYLCIPSTGQCLVPVSHDGGEEDAGVVLSDCEEGQTQSCGSSKLGECRLGVSTCVAEGNGWIFGPCSGAIDPSAESCNGKDDDCDGLIDDGLGTVTCGVGLCERTFEACRAGVPGTCAPGPSSAEVCDGLDNDCNGSVDDGIADLRCGLGQCVRVATACVAGVPQTCNPGGPISELCNGFDDDCDGQVDDDMGQISCGTGQCFRTVDLCVGAQLQTCVPGNPSLESCNGLDDNCNGQTDEALGNTSCGVGACARSVTACVGGSAQLCTPGLPSTEYCDGVDNDCDGSIDEGLGSTNCGVGTCARTQQNCVGGTLRSCVAGSPGTEVCDGKDNDCDGSTDEALPNISCGAGICRRTVVACLNGVPQSCIPLQSGTETCNTLDDDCDGLTDEGCNCVDGNTQSCYTGPTATLNVGVCHGGTQLCTAGNWGNCSAELTPGNESCNGADDDCDGATDEDLPPLTCGTGECFRTVASCAGGAPQSCSPGTPSTEICNGKDDNCNGQTDESLGSTSCGQGACLRTVANCVGGAPQTCSPGATQTEKCDGIDNDCDGQTDEGLGSTTCGVGLCVRTTQNCSGGVAQTCLPGPVQTEICDGLDNDCDSSTDEGLGNTTCGVGVCTRTVANCASGAPQTCNPGTPGAEICNGLDDNCDGQTDENLAPLSCGIGYCAHTVAACAGGTPQTCNPGTPRAEACNGIDDDCDGSTDESFPESGESCPTGIPGLCETGQRGCSSGSLVCNQTVFPVSEVCSNQTDENCNGVIDDPMACGCDSQVDFDYDGFSECDDCNDTDGTVYPCRTELCNGKDDDCDGSIDETFDNDADGFTTCGTKPSGGVDPLRVDCNDTNAFIFPLKLADCGGLASPNTANNVDDNCNGYIDETCSCTATDKDHDGVDTCHGDCDDNDATVAPGKPEVCDGRDNDCRKATVDNCNVSDPCGEVVKGKWTRFPAGTDQCRPDLLCVTNISTGALTCGSLCNQTVGTGLNDSCAATEGCSRNLVDSDNLHLCSVTPTGSKSTGQACTLSSECRTGDCRTTDGPTDYCSDKCTHQSGCGSNTTCSVERGVIPVGQFVGGYYLYSWCQLSTNAPGTRLFGQSCTISTATPPPSSTTCKSGVYSCFNGSCTSPCCNHSDCPSGYGCSINGPKEKTPYTNGGAEVWSFLPVCLSSASSPRISGQACSASSECKSGICDKAQLVCVDLCCNDTSCPYGTTCEMVDYKSSAGKVASIRACVFAPTPALVEQK